MYKYSLSPSPCINQVWPQVYPFIHAMPYHFMAAKEKVTREGSWHVKSTTISEKVQPSERYHLTPLHTTHIYYRVCNVILFKSEIHVLLLLSSIAFSIFLYQIALKNYPPTSIPILLSEKNARRKLFPYNTYHFMHIVCMNDDWMWEYPHTFQFRLRHPPPFPELIQLPKHHIIFLNKFSQECWKRQ